MVAQIAAVAIGVLMLLLSRPIAQFSVDWNPSWVIEAFGGSDGARFFNQLCCVLIGAGFVFSGIQGLT
jgi:hypothetical protein